MAGNVVVYVEMIDPNGRDGGLRMLRGPGVFVTPIDLPADEDLASDDATDAEHVGLIRDPLSDRRVRQAIDAMRHRKEHELDVMALAFDPARPALSADAVKRLAELDVAVVRNPGKTALERAEAFITEFIERGIEGVEHLRRFAQAQRRGAARPTTAPRVTRGR